VGGAREARPRGIFRRLKRALGPLVTRTTLGVATPSPTLPRQGGWGKLVWLVVGFTLAACQPVPRPFLPGDKAVDVTGIAIADKLGVFVAGIDDAPAAMNAALSAALVARLHARGIPASTTGANRGSYLLQCDAEVRDGAVALHWQLIAADGEIAGLFDQIEAARPAAWHAGAPDLALLIAQHAAPRIDALLRDAAPVAVAPSLPRVVVRPVDGAPGDGRLALRRAMERALTRRAVPVVADGAENALMVLGSVHVSEAGRGQWVEVRWTVMAPDGAELGVVSQSNTVPPGALDGPWGELAEAVADGGADGVRALLEAALDPRP